MNILAPLGCLYGRVADLRNTLYDKGVFEVCDLEARTISIGNITVGGTGKTPLVSYVAEILTTRGEKVCILTRGYGRENPGQRVLVSDGEQILANPREAGDEPFELAQKLPGKAIVIADADRVAAADWAKRKFGVTTFVLDDGFQHRRAGRDVDIVCIDATGPFGGGEVLPAGRLREPLRNLRRADVIVITRANLVTEEAISDLRFEISEIAPKVSIFAAENRICGTVELAEFHAKTQRTQSEEESKASGNIASDAWGSRRSKIFAFCGLGNPENFFEGLRRDGFNIIATEAFSDHYVYMQQDIRRIENVARESGAEILLTTAKDAVKLANAKFEIPCFVVEIELIIDDANAFAEMI